MSSASVSVLAPNGRRQTVKCTPNTTIMQIIEEVCKKQGFQSSDYDVKHHNKVLDTTTSLRFSGLPNNAQLELVPVTKVRQESEVTIAINLENGDRVIGNFEPDKNFFDIIMKLCPNELEDNSVIIYTRREIFGNDLNSVTLRNLGLTAGRAMVRLVHKSPEELKTQANVSAPLPSKPPEEKPFHRTFKPVETTSELDNSSNNETSVCSRPVQTLPNNDLLQIAREKRKLNESSGASNEEQRPSRPKIEQGRKPAIDTEQRERMEVESGNTRIKNKNLPMSEDDFIFIGERNAMLFSLETAHSRQADDLPDDFFELTIDDARRILKDIRKKRSDMENGPMLTSALRELEESKKQLRQLNKYKKAIIRVQFPDCTVLQGSFTPTETIQHVTNFVKEYLVDRTLDFYLYTTPPKTILSKDSKLIELGCVPGALLHLGMNSNENKNYLKEEFLDKFTTNSVASLAASKMRQDATRTLPNEDFDIDEPMDADSEPQPGPSTSNAFNNDYPERKIVTSEKVPKWFKPMK